MSARKPYRPRAIPATCTLKNCSRPVGPSDDAITVRLCDIHLAKRLQRQQNRQLLEERRCLYCNSPISTSKPARQKYCNQACERKAARIISDEHGNKVIHHVCWKNAEHAIQRSPHGLASVGTLQDVMVLVRFYEYMNVCAFYFNTIEGKPLRGAQGKINTTPKAAMRLNACHLIASSLGGLNNRKNLIAGPANINRRLCQRIYTPDSNWSRQLFKNRTCKGDGKKLEKVESNKIKTMSLIDALLERYSEAEIIAELSTWTPLPLRDPARNLPYRLPPEPLTQLLLSELHQRFEIKTFGVIRANLLSIYRMFGSLLEGYIEIIAMAVYVALQTADHDGLLHTLKNYQPPARYEFDRTIETLHNYTDGQEHGAQEEHTVIAVYEGSALYPVINKTRRIIKTHLRIDCKHAHDKLAEFYWNIFAFSPPLYSVEKLELIALGSAYHFIHSDTVSPEIRQQVRERARRAELDMRVHHARKIKVSNKRKRPVKHQQQK